MDQWYPLYIEYDPEMHGMEVAKWGTSSAFKDGCVQIDIMNEIPDTFI